MKLSMLSFLTAFALLTSCIGHATDHEKDTIIIQQQKVIGDTVSALGNNIMVVYQDRKNNYWFGSWEDGLFRFDGKTILHFTVKDGLPHNRIEEIKEDESGNLYFNTSQGISKFNGQLFITLPEIESNEWKLQTGDVWFKGNKGPYRYDGKVAHHLKLPKHLLQDPNLEVDPKHSFSPYDIYTIYKDSRGNIWFGTAVFGACRYDGKSIDWISEEDVTELHDGPSNGVRSIIEDKDGYFWFNTLYRYNVYGNRIPKSNSGEQPFYSREKGPGSLDRKNDGNLNEYLSIIKDNSNALWIVTYENGVWRYDGKSITHHVVQDKGIDITLFSIYKDNNGDLWLGTHSHGTYKFNGKTFEKFQL